MQNISNTKSGTPQSQTHQNPLAEEAYTRLRTLYAGTPMSKEQALIIADIAEQILMSCERKGNKLRLPGQGTPEALLSIRQELEAKTAVAVALRKFAEEVLQEGGELNKTPE